MSQVAERALFLWNNEYIVQQITNFKSTIFPIVFESLAKNAEGHWNSTVHGLTYNVQKLLMVRFTQPHAPLHPSISPLWCGDAAVCAAPCCCRVNLAAVSPLNTELCCSS